MPCLANFFPGEGWWDVTVAESTRHRPKAAGLKIRIVDVTVYLKCSKKWFSQLRFGGFGQPQHLAVTIPLALGSRELPCAHSNLPFCVELLGDAVCRVELPSWTGAPLRCRGAAQCAQRRRRGAALEG